MDENALRCLLAGIAETPEPLDSKIDVDAARHAGRVRWARRALAPVAGAAAVVVAAGIMVAVPHGLSLGPQRARPAAASQPSASATAAPAPPALFNPLVPYADFGQLPGGFSQEAVPRSLGQLKEGTFLTSLTTVMRTASQPSTGRELRLTVSSVKACKGVTVTPRKAASPPQVPTGCAFSGYDVTAKAPAVNGRPAYWVDYDSLAWEYAPGAWAELSPQAGEAKPAAQAGWVTRSWPDVGPKDAQAAATEKIIEVDPRLAIKEGFLAPPSAATLALLRQVASQVKFGQRQPLLFPFQSSAPLTHGLEVTSAGFYVAKGQLIGASVSVGPAALASLGLIGQAGLRPTVKVGLSAEAAGLWISTSPPGTTACSFAPGDSIVRLLGVPWVEQVEQLDGSQAEQSLCTMDASGDGTAGLSVWIAASSTGSLTAHAVAAGLTFLGTSPSGWTARPFR